MNTNTDQTPTATTPDKWQAEREHFAKGGRVQWRRPSFPNRREWSEMSDGHASVEIGCPKFASDCEYRIHPDDLKPVEAPAVQEKCPTCGSADKAVRESVGKPNCGPPLFPCQDAWHNPQPPQEKWEPKVGDKVHVSEAYASWPKDMPREVILHSEYREKGLWNVTHQDRPDIITNLVDVKWLEPAPSTEKWSPRFKVGDRVMDTEDHACHVWTVDDIVNNGYDLSKPEIVGVSQAWLPEDRLRAAWSLPTPPSGQQWHRVDWWREEWLKDGYRPLLHGEPCQADDEVLVNGEWTVGTGDVGFPMGIMHNHTRTRRPAPSTDNPSRILTPEELTKLCGNQPPHRTDGWKAEWLPSGWRPLLADEEVQVGDQHAYNGAQAIASRPSSLVVAHPTDLHLRTRRPAPTQPATAKTAGGLRWHRLSELTRDDVGTIELLAATCEDGIGVIARWRRRNDGGWDVSAMDTECGIMTVLADFDEGEAVPPEPPTVFDDAAFASSAEPQEVPSKPAQPEDVFKGAQGLQELADCEEFWEKQPYGTRFYFGISYLHRGVLRSFLQDYGLAKSRAESAEAKVKQLEGEIESTNRAVMKLRNEKDDLTSDRDYWKACAKQDGGEKHEAQQTADALRREVETITADRDTLESYYQKVTKVALDCSPIPESQRPDNQIEPPWEVFARVKAESQRHASNSEAQMHRAIAAEGSLAAEKYAHSHTLNQRDRAVAELNFAIQKIKELAQTLKPD